MTVPEPFEWAPVDPWTGCTGKKDGTAKIVQGACKRCGHITAKRFDYVYASATDSTPSAASGEQQTILCDCQQKHPGREDDQGDCGCGAYWFGSPDDA